VNDATRRSLRTFLQVGVVEGVLQLLEAFGLALTADQHAAIIVVATPLLTLAMNLLEDNTNMPAVLKAPASEGQNPAPQDAGTP
jgi:hypothetical protein